MSSKKEFLDFVFDTRIPDDVGIDEEKKLVTELFHKSWDVVPSRLFRYRQCNRNSFEALENDKFLLSKPTEFNDPYDSLIYVDKNSIYKKLFQASDIDLVTKLNEDSVFREEEIKTFGKQYIDEIIARGEFKNKEEKDFYTKLSKKVYGKLIDDIIEMSLTSLNQSALVGCLSEKFDSILMWSHYAKNHTGFVVSYDLKERFSIESKKDGRTYSDFVDKKIFPVRYSAQRYDATEFIENTFIYNYHKIHNLPEVNSFFDKLFYYKYLLHKSSDWKYEREWRIIKQVGLHQLDNSPKFDFMHHIMPKEIYLGTRISKWDEKILRDIAEKKNIEIFKMDLKYFDGKYKLTKTR